MFQVPVTFCAPYAFLVENETNRQFFFHELASQGAKHVVLSEGFANKMLANADFAQKVWCELRYEGMSFVDAHAPYGELLDMNCPIQSFRPRMLETQKRTIELCASLGVKTLTIHVGNNHWVEDAKLRDLEYNRRCIEESLEKLLPVAEACGVIICIENIWFQTNTPEELLRYKSLVPTDALGFCYDAGHANIMADVPGREHPMLSFWKERNGVDKIPLDNHILEKMLPHVRRLAACTSFPIIVKPNAGMPVRFSTTDATALKSVPIIMGMGVPAMAMNRGFSCSAAETMSEMSFSSSPMMASISEMPERNTMLSWSYQRGSSCVE